MINTPDGAQQTDKRCGGTDGGQQHLAILQPGQCQMQGVTQYAGELLRSVASRRQRTDVFPSRCQQHGYEQPFPVKGLHSVQRLGDRCGLPECRDGARHIRADTPQQPALPENHDPAANRHGQQQQCNCLRHGVTLQEQLCHVHCKPSTSAMLNKPVFLPARKCAARKLPCA